MKLSFYVLIRSARSIPVFACGAARAVRWILWLFQPDGRVIAVGNFTSLEGTNAGGNILRFQANGSRDASFHPILHYDARQLILQEDGRVVVNSYVYWSDTWIGRYLQNGSPDPAFLPPPRPDRWVNFVATYPGGRLLVAGQFWRVGNVIAPSVARLNSDGSLDPTFRAGFLDDSSSQVMAVAVQSNGQIVIGGGFSRIDHVPMPHVARLNGDTPPPPTPAPHWTAASYYVSEEESTVTLRIVRDAAPDAALMAFSTRDSTAVAGQNYVRTNGLVRFAAGDFSKDVVIALQSTNLLGSRFFEVILTNAVSGGETDSPRVARVFIGNGASRNALSFLSARFYALEIAGSASVEVIRDLASTGVVSVAYSTADGTARAGVDFGAVSGRLTFNEGEFTNRFVVPLLYRPGAEPNRTLLLRLSDPASGGQLREPGEASLTIFDADASGNLTGSDTAALPTLVKGGLSTSLNSPGTVLVTEPMLIRTNITIEGNGPRVVLDGGGRSRLFHVLPGGELTLRNVTLANGWNTNGGAILNEGRLTLIDCIFTNNVAAGADGRSGTAGAQLSFVELGEPGGNGQPGAAGRGGAIFNLAQVMISGGAFQGNNARGGRGGSGGTGAAGGKLTTSGCCGTAPGAGGNAAGGGDGSGGAIYSAGTMAITNTSFQGNEAFGGAAGTAGNAGAPTANTACSDYAAGGLGAIGGAARGGAIYNAGVLRLRGTVLSENLSRGGSGSHGVYGMSSLGLNGCGGIGGASGTSGGNATGGGLVNDGWMEIEQGSFSSNAALGGSGGDGGSGGGTYSGFPGWGGHGGMGGDGQGGAIWNTGMQRLQDSHFSFNWTAPGLGGNGGTGASARGDNSGSTPRGGSAGSGGDALGGALYCRSNVVVLENVVFGSNTVVAGSGASGGVRGYALSQSPGQFQVSGLGAAGGSAAGGALYASAANVVVRGGYCFENFVAGGSAGTHRSSPHSFPGPVPAGADGPAGGSARGGGIFLDLGSVTLDRVTLSANSLVGGVGGQGGPGGDTRYSDSPGGAGGAGGTGGSAEGAGAYLSRAGLAATNLTVAANNAAAGMGGRGGPAASQASGGSGGNAGPNDGGGLFLRTTFAALVHVTVASNLQFEATGGSGGLSGGSVPGTASNGASSARRGAALAVFDSSVGAVNSIFAAAANTQGAFGPIADLGHNISSDASANFTNPTSRNHTDPILGPLANNDGFAPTMALLSGSPAIDAADSAFYPPGDQRGVARPYGEGCDIGAYELDQPTFTIAGTVRSDIPVAGLPVRAGQAVAITDELGRYTLRNLLAGTFEVAPDPVGSGFTPPSQIVTVGPSLWRIRFTPNRARLASIASPSPNELVLQIAGAPGREYVLETSTNLIQWQYEAQLPPAPDGNLRWRWTNSATPQKFWRVRE